MKERGGSNLDELFDPDPSGFLTRRKNSTSLSEIDRINTRLALQAGSAG
jgi:hypothetical protein